MKQLLREIITNWSNQPLPMIKPRDIDLTAFFDPTIKKIITVVGFRRVGKTFTLLDFAQKHGQAKCVYINLEDERLPQKIETLTNFSDSITELYGAKPIVLLVDEIQNIPGWSVWARRINETTPHHLIISGSSSKLSSRELPTELRGHALTIEITTLSWREFLHWREIDAAHTPTSHMLHSLRDFLFCGGLPEIVLAEAGLRPLLVTEYFNTFVTRDIIERYRLRNTEALRELLGLLLNSTFYTISKLTNTLKSLGHTVSKSTILKYVAWLESSFFLSPLELWSPSIKNRRQAARKAYFIDTYFPVRFGTKFSENIGHLMEQAVYLEIKRRLNHEAAGEVFYWRDYQNHEVDFTIRRPVATELLQVNYASSVSDIAARETTSLIKASQTLGSIHRTLITWDLETTLTVEDQTIECVPLWKWLLKK